jgi:hypothetical protein
MSTDIAKPRAEHSTRIGPSGRLRTAILMMVWQGIDRDSAAQATGLNPKSVYNAFRKHHVRRFHNEELRALRESKRAKILHRLEALAMQDGNAAAAVKACQIILTDDSERDRAANMQYQAGLVVVIEGANARIAPAAPAKVIEPDREPPDAA